MGVPLQQNLLCLGVSHHLPSCDSYLPSIPTPQQEEEQHGRKARVRQLDLGQGQRGANWTKEGGREGG